MASMKPAPSAPARHADEDCVLVLQGGGAMGAYQAGVFEALTEQGQAPQWVAGISIGAINAALIAGNPPELRVARLREFWQQVSSPCSAATFEWPTTERDWLNQASALQALWLGVPGFFSPRIPPAPFQALGSPGALSYYDSTPLRQTLERLVDFERLNSGAVRLSVGAVNVRSGNFAYFDSADHHIDVRHIMASGALPPGFAPVEIDGESYWDGGLVSNTPLQHVLDQPCAGHRIVFQVDLFPARGPLPRDLAEVAERQKEIRFSSRTRLNTTVELERQAIAQAAQRLVAKLPPALHDDPDARFLASLRADAEVAVVHLIYRSRQPESESRDYEFSCRSMLQRWSAGHADTVQTLNDPRWLKRTRHTSGVRVYDLTSADAKPSPLNTIGP